MRVKKSWKFYLYSIVFLFLVFIIAVFRNLCLTGSGKVNRNSMLQNRIENYHNKTIDLLYLDKGRRLLSIGHRAGNYKRYPKSLSSYINGEADDISTLMSESFDLLQLDGIEIDIQIENNIVYVTHDPLRIYNKSDQMVKKFLQNNTLEKILEYFFDNYHKQNKYLYIEIKCKDDKKLNKNDLLLIETTLNTFNEVIKKNQNIENIDLAKNQIAFISFNYMALKELNKLNDGYNLFLIIATNSPLGYLFTKFPSYNHLNYLDDDLKTKLERDTILKGIWFDPIGINFTDDFCKLIQLMNETRKSHSLTDLQFYISTYKLEEECYYEKLKQFGKKLKYNKNNLINLKGLIFDFAPSTQL